MKRALPFLLAENVVDLVAMLPTWGCPGIEASLWLGEEHVGNPELVFLAKLHQAVTSIIPHPQAMPANNSYLFSLSDFRVEVTHDVDDIIS